MKNNLLLLILIIFVNHMSGQDNYHAAIKYQTVLRDLQGNPLVNQQVGIKLSFRQGNPNGPAVYYELHNTETNEYGLINIDIGFGNLPMGSFDNIPWSEDSFFLQLEMDQTGGNDYQYIGTVEMLSVPYAFYADSSGTDNDWVINGDNLYSALEGNVGIGTDVPGAKLSVVGTVRSGYDETKTDFLEIRHGSSNAVINWGRTGRLDFRYESNTLMSVLQDGRIGIGAEYAAGSALLQLNSITQGFLPPKMSAVNIAEIENPKSGLIVFNNTDGHFYVFRENHGNVWQRLALDVGTITPDHICGEPFHDARNNQTYGTAHIGDQCWMTENMNIGNQIPSSMPQYDEGTIEKYCCDDDPSNCDTYGGLYQWGEAMQYSLAPGAQGICPEGWHIPTDEEICELENFVDQYNVSCIDEGYRGTDCGLNLKAESGWNNSGNGTDAFGFTALPGGRFSSGAFHTLGDNAYFWSSTEYDGYAAWERVLGATADMIGRFNSYKENGFSIRCLRDLPPVNEPPEQPSSPNPENGAIDQPANTDLEWTCSDPESDPLEYEICFGIDPDPPVVAQSITEKSFDPGILQNGTLYFWKIVAHDDHGNTTEGPVWSFETIDCEGNEPIGEFCIYDEVAEPGSTFSYCESDMIKFSLCNIVQGTGPFNVCWKVDNGPVECITVDEGENLYYDFLSTGEHLFKLISIVDAVGCAKVFNNWESYFYVIINPLPEVAICINGDYIEPGSEYSFCESGYDVIVCYVFSGVGPFEINWMVNGGPNVTSMVVNLWDPIIIAELEMPGNYLIEFIDIWDLGTTCYNSFVNYDVTINIQEAPFSFAGFDLAICEDESSVYLNGYTENASGSLWTTTGDGYFENALASQTLYYPGTNDMLSGSVILTLEAIPIDPCTMVASDEMTLTINGNVEINAGMDMTFCESESGYLLEDAYGFNYYSVFWTTSGDGYFVDDTILHTMYFHGPLDLENGGATLTLTAYPVEPCTDTVADDKQLTILRLPTVDAGPDQTVCQGEVVQLSADAQYYTSLEWYTEDGLGYFQNPYEPETKYIPSFKDYDEGFVRIFIMAASLDPCIGLTADSLDVFFPDPPYTYAGPDQPNLEGTSTMLEGSEPPTGGTGLWSILGGEGGAIEEPDNPNSLFTGQSGIFYQLQWEIIDENNCQNNDTVAINFMPSWLCEGDVVDDRDQAVYPVTHIGNQCWMGKNLGWLPEVSSSFQGSDTEPFYYVYGYNGSSVDDAKATTNYQTYGTLYNWPAATIACPEGWHLPEDDELKVLEGSVDSQYPVGDPKWDETGYRGLDAGLNLKSISGWNNNGNGLDTYDFSALPGGYRDKEEGFEGEGTRGRWWSSSENPTINAWYRKLYRSFDRIGRDTDSKKYGYSVRCLKDEAAPNLPPDSPSDPAPEDGAQNQPVYTELSWKCTDPEMDVLTYDVYLGVNPDPPLIVSGISDTTFDPGILTGATEYFWKITAHDDHGNSTEGLLWSFTTETLDPQSCPEIPYFEYGGQIYNTVLIGDQCWMAENLNIGERIDGAYNQTDNQTIEKYCYADLEENCDTYGGLYQWHEMMDYTTEQGGIGICPDGWHLPAFYEWETLCFEVGGIPSDFSWGIAGGRLKETDTAHWEHPNTGATNEFGYTALPAGWSTYPGQYTGMGQYNYYWSSSQQPSLGALWMKLSYNTDYVEYLIYGQERGYSVRCVFGEYIPTNEPPVLYYDFPGNGQGELPIDQSIYWNYFDPDNDPVSLDVYFGVDPDPPLIVSGYTESYYDPEFLQYNTEYYWKIIAYDDQNNVTEGPVWNFTTASWTCGDSIGDARDGRYYNTEQIGNQCWMSENLAYLPSVSPASEGSYLDSIYYVYGYEGINVEEAKATNHYQTFGVLYNWVAALDACPEGMVLPTDEDWKILEGTADTQYPVGDPIWDEISFRGFDAGKNLKSDFGWQNGGNGIDLFNFSALPGGYRGSDGNFYSIYNFGSWWSSTYAPELHTFGRILSYDEDGSSRNLITQNYGYSIRCIKE